MADTQRLVRDTILANPSDIAVAVGAVSVVLMIVIPVPAVLLDVLLTFNLTVGLLILLIVLYTKKATEFSIFPTMLLVTTVFGLALNISTTRLILSKGANFDVRIIRAFASFVVGAGGTDGLVIGFIIFIIIIAVQAIVITKGATRIAEVAARFTLDGLPGKQMSIDAEYNSGSISEDEALRRKSEVQREVDFYGQMDGATKFISGNVKVGIFISVINLVGGFIIGMVLHK
ncbi:MAG: FHIPEP family type III secretion protein, partial [Treponema sp.]|nr:FHIPEP family type III secretion protein [Treponema sp.]